MIARMRSAGVSPSSSRMEIAAEMGSGAGDSDLGFFNLGGAAFSAIEASFATVVLQRYSYQHAGGEGIEHDSN